ncbi:MAG: hypothetical protein P9M14_17125 [Candidatus Alcyoniella australis]|nr:hypothetical protein [Candidatus Alcyoniella australis]
MAELQSTSARVLRELLATPAFREIVLLNVREMQPEEARELVRTALWTDPAFSLSMAAAAPQAVNCLIEALVELAVQLNSFPPQMMNEFGAGLAQQVRTERLTDLAGELRTLIQRTLQNDPQLGKQLTSNAIKAVNGLVRAANQMLDDRRRSRELFADLDVGQLLRLAWRLGWSLVRELVSRALGGRGR